MTRPDVHGPGHDDPARPRPAESTSSPPSPARRPGEPGRPGAPEEISPHRPGRRQLLRAGTVGAGTLGVGAAAIGLDRALRDPAASAAPAEQAGPTLHGEETVPFHGAHQAGIETAPAASATFLALDLHQEVDREGVLRMLRLLTDDAARLTQGRAALADTEPELAGRPSRLTITAGFGPGLMERADREAPHWLAPLPAFSIDALEDHFTGGDLLLQVAAEDPLTVSHAARMLLKDARAFASVRWVQRGFRRAQGTQAPGSTMRNLFGQLDGSANPQLGSEHFAKVVWIDDGPFTGGTSMVLRRIRMDLDGWDEVDRIAREKSTGRSLDDGAPLSGGTETSQADFEAVSDNGFAVIPDFAHMRRARGVDEGEHQEIYRRPYNYDVPPPPDSTALSESGQLFAAFQADLTGQFLPIQQRLADLDLLNQWTTPIGSAVFAIPPGCTEGEYLGQSVLA
ncbi:MAG: Dyp-type peroxidase [Brachybacterium sp.]|uniref:Dyp-type peroxidase n=1 Tax=Brachybacterium sp. TaxID=1891286 RepID=UPI0026481FD5|nr:Dyp-type peroxidase [Brachybacterium sp.]MDN5688488.1 Dyp-type peroxidase [Brachybacterium sp.]